jgi:ribonuclease P protein component
MTHLPATGADVTEPPRVAFAIPRKVGGAVVRNRLRRQVRGHLERRHAGPAPLPPGALLVALRPGAAEVAPAALRDDVDRCLDRLAATHAGSDR